MHMPLGALFIGVRQVQYKDGSSVWILLVLIQVRRRKGAMQPLGNQRPRPAWQRSLWPEIVTQPDRA